MTVARADRLVSLPFSRARRSRGDGKLRLQRRGDVGGEFQCCAGQEACNLGWKHQTKDSRERMNAAINLEAC